MRADWELSRDELGQRIYQVSYLQGEFRLRSGSISKEYFDKYRFEADPKLLWNIALQMKPLVPEGTEVLAGLEMGGIPLAVALSLATEIPAAFVRKKAKEYGTCQLAEGVSVQGRRVCVIEDVVTTGGQVVISTGDLRRAGALVTTVICAINRSALPQPLEEAQLELRALFKMDELTRWGR